MARIRPFRNQGREIRVFAAAKEYQRTGNKSLLDAGVRRWLAWAYPETFKCWRKDEDPVKFGPYARDPIPKDLPLPEIVYPDFYAVVSSVERNQMTASGFRPESEKRFIPAIWYPMEKHAGADVEIHDLKRLWDWVTSGARNLEVDQIIGPYENYGPHLGGLDILPPELHFCLTTLPKIPEPDEIQQLRLNLEINDMKAPSVEGLFPVDPLSNVPYEAGGEDVSEMTRVEGSYQRPASVSTDSDVVDYEVEDYGTDRYRVGPTQHKDHKYYSDRQSFVAYDNRFDYHLEDHKSGISWKLPKRPRDLRGGISDAAPALDIREYAKNARLPGKQWSKMRMIEEDETSGGYTWPEWRWSDNDLLVLARRDAWELLDGRPGFEEVRGRLRHDIIEDGYEPPAGFDTTTCGQNSSQDTSTGESLSANQPCSQEEYDDDDEVTETVGKDNWQKCSAAGEEWWADFESLPRDHALGWKGNHRLLRMYADADKTKPVHIPSEVYVSVTQTRLPQWTFSLLRGTPRNPAKPKPRQMVLVMR